MSVQNPYTERIEIRIEPEVKQAIQLLCANTGYYFSKYFRALARRNLKKNGYIITRFKPKKIYFDNIEDMPEKLDYEKEQWIKIVG